MPVGGTFDLRASVNLGSMEIALAIRLMFFVLSSRKAIFSNLRIRSDVAEGAGGFVLPYSDE
jgi:hypothetical protein